MVCRLRWSEKEEEETMHYWVKASPSDFSGTLPRPRRHLSLSSCANSLRFIFAIIVTDDYFFGVSVATLRLASGIRRSSCLVASSTRNFWAISLFMTSVLLISDGFLLSHFLFVIGIVLLCYVLPRCVLNFVQIVLYVIVFIVWSTFYLFIYFWCGLELYFV